MNSNKDKIILDLCGGTGAWSEPYREAGYDVRVITLPRYDVTRWGDYRDLTNLIRANKIHGILSAPPCTMFSIARNDTRSLSPRNVREGMKIVNACLDLIHECLYRPYRINANSLKFWALENPDGYLKRFLGKPALEFHPCDYGDPYTKRTHLWGMFNELKKTPVPVSQKGNFVKNVEHFYHMKMKQMPDGYKKETGLKNRTIIRSITPHGFAQAFYKANP